MQFLLRNNSTLLAVFVLLGVLAPQKLRAEQPYLNPELMENNHHAYCTPIFGQVLDNGIPVTQIIGHDCQALVGGTLNLEAVKEQEETKRKQLEIEGKMTLLQFFIPRSF
jgi:hypothetical protein